jgi:ribosomal protein S14
MKKLYVKDKKNRFLFCQDEFKRFVFLFLFKSSLRFDFRSYFLTKRDSQFKFHVSTQIINRCFVTNRSRSVLSFFCLSRITLKEFARRGLLVGIRKSSW